MRIKLKTSMANVNLTLKRKWGHGRGFVLHMQLEDIKCDLEFSLLQVSLLTSIKKV